MLPRLTPIDVRLPAHGVFLLESHHAPGFRMAPSRHDFLEVFFLLQGAGTFHVAGRAYRGERGDAVVVPVGALHQIEDDPGRPLSLYGLCVAPRVYQAEPAVVDALPAGRLPAGGLVLPRARAELRELLFEQTLARPGHRLVMAGLAVQLLAALARGAQPARAAPPPSDHDTAVRRYLAELPGRFYEPASLDQTAAALGMSRRRFTQLFRAAAGTSWLAHLTGLRIDYACQLLTQTTRGILAVAFECGYEDLSSFYRAFKRRKQATPNEWRQRGV